MRIFKKISVRFSLILKGISAFSTYCFLNNLYSTKYTTYALEQLICEKSYMFFAYVDSGKLMLSWQQRVLLFPKHREHFLRFKMLLFIFITMFFYILLLPMSSLIFFVTFEICNWLVLEICFQGFVDWLFIPVFSNNFTDV